MNNDKRNIFFIIAESRSGSNWLTETLSNHPDIFMLKEVFQVDYRKEFAKKSCMNELMEIDSDIQYIRRLFEGNNKQLCGCKILTAQAVRFMDFYNFVEYYHQQALFICLSQKNSIKAELSGEIARRLKRWHVWENNGELFRVKLVPEHFLRRLLWRKAGNDFVRSLMDAYGIRPLEISYESLFNNKNHGVKRILDFLKVEYDETVINSIFSREKKTTPFSFREIVINYEEMESFLKCYPEYFHLWKEESKV